MWIYDLKYYWRKWRSNFFWIALGILLLFIFRFQILGMFGGYLICEDEIEHTEAVFVLGGNPETRAKKAAEVYKAGYADEFITTGGHRNNIAAKYNMPDSEAGITKAFMEHYGIPSEKVEALSVATSTREESFHIFSYCQSKGWKKIMLITDRFHTRRVTQVFRNKFTKAGIEVVIVGVSNEKYKEERYWEQERGLVMVIEEYIKMVHYLVN